MKLSNITFSVIIPCFNQGHFLEQALESVLVQDYRHLEVLIVNDGSTDNTLKIAESYRLKDSRFRIITQENQGLSAARNTGLKQITGDFIVFLDADDWLLDGFFKSYSNTIQEFPDFDLFRCGYAYWSVDKMVKYHTHLPRKDGLIYPCVLTHNIGACHSILISKSLANQVGDFDTSLKSCEDWDYWIRAGKLGAKIKSLPQELVAYRYSLDSMSRNAKVMYSAFSEVTQRALNIDQRIPESPSNQNLNWDISFLIKNHFLKCLGILLHQGKIKEALSWYQEEQGKWHWSFEAKDFSLINSQLTFRYFLHPEQIKNILETTFSNCKRFFDGIGFTKKQQRQVLQLVFEPQLKKRNHLRYGRFLGSILNKAGLF
jgi:glycosyltransferase involved in cell wall biosynthesis